MNKTQEAEGRCGGSAGSFAMGLLCGAAAGAALGLLFAPKSGLRFRRDLGAQADRLRRKAADLYDDATESLGDLAARGKQVIEKVRV